MNSFEFVFSLFGLLLGLGLAEVLGGFGTAVQKRSHVRIGLLTPLLGLLVALDLTSFWTTAWAVRDDIPTHYFSMMCGLLLTGLYYLVARTVFPDDPAEWPDYDAYFDAHKAWVLAGVFLCNLLAMAGQIALGYDPFAVPLFTLMTVLFFVLIGAAIAVRGRRASLALLALICLMYPLTAVAALLMGV